MSARTHFAVIAAEPVTYPDQRGFNLGCVETPQPTGPPNQPWPNGGLAGSTSSPGRGPVQRRFPQPPPVRGDAQRGRGFKVPFPQSSPQGSRSGVRVLGSTWALIGVVCNTSQRALI